MEAMTSSFPSSAPTGTQLDNTIFYPGPASKEGGVSTPTEANEWPDIDEMFAEAAQQDWGTGIEQLDLIGGFVVTERADIRAPNDTSSAAQGATSLEVYSEQINSPPWTPLYQHRGQSLQRGAATKPQEETDVSGGRAQNRLVGTLGHSSSGVPGLVALPCRFSDNAQLDLGREFRHTGSNTGAERSDDSSPYGRGHVQRPLSRPPTGGDDRDTMRRSVRSPASEQRDGRRRELDMDVDTFLSKAPQATVDQADSTSSTDTAAADDDDGDNDDSDEPLLPRRRRQRRPSVRSSNGAVRASSPSTPRSRLRSTEVESTKILRRRKRLHSRKGTRRDSPTRNSDKSSATPATSTSSVVTSERWSVQCFLRRTLVGSQEVIAIECPAFALLAPSDRDAALSTSDQTARTTPVVVVARGNRRRARFSKKEDDLLVELKGRKEPTLSWREIHSHFPSRTTGSLQVHYSKQLKGRRFSNRRSLKR